MKCKRCGQCCISASVTLNNVLVGQDRMELARWLSYHGCEIEERPTMQGRVVGVKIPILCEHLVFGKDGKAACEIYETRPVICREHWCQRSK